MYVSVSEKILELINFSQTENFARSNRHGTSENPWDSE